MKVVKIKYCKIFFIISFSMNGWKESNDVCIYLVPDLSDFV